MTYGPNFDELVGAEPTGGERERLRRTHELLLQAGPPPELPPELARGPQLGRAEAARRRRIKRRALLALAAAALVAVVFAAGYSVATSGGGSGPKPVAALALKGTSAVPRARATLEVFPGDAGNWPMKLAVVGLPKLPPHAYYAVFLVRKGEQYLSCGTFVTAGGARPFTVSLNAPYQLRRGDTWVVTREAPHSGGHGTTVLKPT